MVGLHTSEVHALPSSQSNEIGTYWQPKVGLHVSEVHALPSSQAELLDVCTHVPVSVLQLSMVQALPSSHCSAPAHSSGFDLTASRLAVSLLMTFNGPYIVVMPVLVWKLSSNPPAKFTDMSLISGNASVKVSVCACMTTEEDCVPVAPV
jgi:hypothetical protein